MSDSLNNKELVAVGHQFAKAMSTDTPIIDMAKIVSRLAERLDCTTAALHATQAQRDQHAAENAGLKNFIISDCHVAHIEPETFYEEEVTRYVSADGYEPETPATDAFLAEVLASAITDALEECSEYLITDCVMDRLDISYEDAELRSSGAIELHDALVSVANQLRQEAAQ
ncbi:hypothetical protein [Enterobacter roggenkampii]|uniref:hypothetical protein n=1 Tax=Enterobacter roggenkampii TaxID=1812935 RepID=UPI003D684F5A